MGMRADTEQQKRRDTVPSVSERMLGCGGIRRGAYGLVESHHARGACHISSRKKFVQRIQLHHKMKRNRFYYGFTLIELLVVISIIALLSSVVLASLNSARSKSRDTKRIADFKQIQTALEFFYDKYGQYPVTASAPTWDGHWQFLSTCLETGAGCGIATPGFQPLMSKVPQDPLDDINTLSDADPTYYYAWPSGCNDGQSYKIAVLLENTNSALQSDLDGSFYNSNNLCEDSNKGYCVGVGTCSGW